MEPFALPDPHPPALPDPLALNRSTVARPGAEKLRPEAVEELLRDPSTRVVLVDGARVLVTAGGAGDAAEGGAPRLALAGTDVVRDAVHGAGELFYLGRDDANAYLGWSRDLSWTGDLLPIDGRPGQVAVESLRDVGHLLGARDVGLATTAVALSQWRRTHRHCPRCGAPTTLVEAGWAGRCPADGYVVYPRTDPAVIMAVHDGAGRLLLARSVAWPETRRSVLAGFVEAGEDPESAVRREVGEEVGITIGRVVYAGAQPWPFPASLMLGYHAWVEDPEQVSLPRPDGTEITHAAWFAREELAAELAAGRLSLPMRTSIALALIESWYGREVPA